MKLSILIVLPVSTASHVLLRGDPSIDVEMNGYITSDAVVNVSSCPAGTYQDDTSSAASFAGGSCTNCPAGKVSSGTGNTSCTPCAAGTYSPAAGSTNCILCPSDKFASGTGSSSCAACPPGTYTEGFGNTVCKPCNSDNVHAKDTHCSQL